MALRVFRPFTRLQDDPWTNDDDAKAVSELEEFIKDAACPSWVVSRFEQHNRAATRKRKASERKDECGDKQATEAVEAHEDEAEDETDQGVMRRQTEANASPPVYECTNSFPPLPSAAWRRCRMTMCSGGWMFVIRV